MRKLIYILLILASISLSAETKFTPELFKKLAENRNKIPVIKVPDYKKVVLKNGITFYIAESHDLPIVEVRGVIVGGRSQENRESAGITNVMTEIMTTGTKSMDEKSYSEFKGIHGLSYILRQRGDYIDVNANALSEDREELVKIVSDSLMNPNFGGEYVKRVISEKLQGLMQRKVEDDNIVQKFFYNEVYGDHPYSYAFDYNVQIAAVRTLTKESLESYYNSTIGPENTVIGIIGDFNIDAMEKLLRKSFGGWKRKNISLKEVKVESLKKAKIIIVNKPDATQASIRMGYLSYNWDSPDRVAFKIADRIFGGGSFESRLMEEIRSKKGYAYSIASYNREYKYGGDYNIVTKVDPKNAVSAVEVIKDEMVKIRSGEKKISEKELRTKVNFYNGLFPSAFKDKVDILSSEIVDMEVRKRGSGYISKFVKEYNELTQARAQKVFTDNTFPEDFVIVVLGKKEILEPLFKEKGFEVEVKEME